MSSWGEPIDVVKPMGDSPYWPIKLGINVYCDGVIRDKQIGVFTHFHKDHTKAIEDRLVSGFSLIILSPVMVLIALGVKLSSSGPVYYRQERVSWNGLTFSMLKFRSMPVDAEWDKGAQWATSGDERPTRFGRFLRRTSLDELPQLINVLKGDMSIVGPRPERPVFIEEFKTEIPDYMQKHLVKAGITGWAQVNGWRGDTDLKTRIEYDIYYIEHWSIMLDIKIMAMTLIKGMIHKNAY